MVPRNDVRTGAAEAAPPPLIVLEPGSGRPLWRQIYDQLRDAVVGGRLRPGARIPASRQMADDLMVSRNSVTAAYDQLVAEGYLEQRVRQGTFVASALPDRLAKPRKVPLLAPPAHAVPSPSPLSPAGEVFVRAARRLAVPTGPRLTGADDPVPFRLGDPALDAFPVRLWARIVSRRWRAGGVPLGYSHPAGERALREAIAHYLGASRGVRCAAEQVFVVSGTQQALDLATRLVLGPGAAAWTEDPGYPGARAAISATGATLVPVPVDEHGLDVEAGIRAAPGARLAYVTPSHQFPAGAVMSLARRAALLAWASDAGAWILEDDYDSEFRYASRPLPALQGLDGDGRVIYTGTFSKTLFPALRLAYVVAPPALADAFAAACVLGGRHAPTDTQLAAGDFIREGHFDRHLRKMRAEYAHRQQVLLETARELLGEWIEMEPAPAGLHLVGWLSPARGAAEALVRRAADAGIEVAALSQFAERRLERDALLFGYGAFTPERLREATERLARVLSAKRAE